MLTTTRDQLLCYACEGMALVSVSSGSGAVVG